MRRRNRRDFDLKHLAQEVRRNRTSSSSAEIVSPRSASAIDSTNSSSNSGGTTKVTWDECAMSAALSSKLDAVLVALADQPLINEQDITALISAYKKRPQGASVVVPRVGGEPGNPVIFSASMRDQILSGGANVGCRHWRAAHPAEVASFDTDNRRFRLDVDTLEDIERFERDTGHALRWPAARTAVV